MEIQGKRAIVLGGTSGIGLAAAVQLTRAGAEVIACSRSAAHHEPTLRAHGIARCEVVDVLDRAGLSALFARHAPFDILVNAATGGPRAGGPFLKMDLDAFQGSFAKLWGYVHSVRLGAGHMAQDGTIVLVSGYPARKCNPGMSAISTVGNAVEGFVRAVAPELVPRRINVVSPGVIDTPLFAMPDDQRASVLGQMTARNLFPRAGRADEVADAIVFLIRNDFVTGTTIDVDGGALLP